MAELINAVPHEFEHRGDTWSEHVTWHEKDRAEKEAMETLEKRSTVFKHPVADGYAFYEVVKMNPLALCWIPYGDNWKAPAALIRGLTTSDIESYLRLKKLIGKIQEANV